MIKLVQYITKVLHLNFIYYVIKLVQDVTQILRLLKSDTIPKKLHNFISLLHIWSTIFFLSFTYDNTIIFLVHTLPNIIPQSQCYSLMFTYNQILMLTVNLIDLLVEIEIVSIDWSGVADTILHRFHIIV